MMSNNISFSQYGFESELLDEIQGQNEVILKPGTVILREKEYIKQIPLVLSGSIRLGKITEKGREIIFYHIKPGESCILSITSCLNNKGSQAIATVEEETHLIAIEAERIRKWMDLYPTFRKFVVGLYYDRLAELMTLVDEITFNSVDKRLMKFLHDNAVDDIIEITHQQLAAEIGTAREVISRLLKQMENEKSISMQRGRIKLLHQM
jgi:CRP/FNR family transcriptional regulator